MWEFTTRSKQPPPIVHKQPPPIVHKGERWLAKWGSDHIYNFIIQDVSPSGKYIKVAGEWDQLEDIEWLEKLEDVSAPSKT
jgi:hypothetical protein